MTYELNKIYCTDCYQAIKDIPNKSVDLIYTDIPYDFEGNGVVSSGSCFDDKKRDYHGEYEKISKRTTSSFLDKAKRKSTDETSEIAFGIDYLILEEFCRILKNINCYIWCSKKQILPIMKYFIDKKGCLFELLTWHKTNPIPTCNNTYLSDTEYCLLFREKNTGIGGNVETKSKYYISSTNKRDKDKFEHSTIKPLMFVQNHILNSTRGGDIVLDPFMGSGTTAVACKNLGRNFIGFEINPKWHKIACDRLNNQDASGQLSFFTI